MSLSWLLVKPFLISFFQIKNFIFLIRKIKFLNFCVLLIDLSSFIFALSSFICCWTDRTIEILVDRTCKYYSFYWHVMGRFSLWHMSLTSVKTVKIRKVHSFIVFQHYNCHNSMRYNKILYKIEEMPEKKVKRMQYK